MIDFDVVITNNIKQKEIQQVLRDSSNKITEMILSKPTTNTIVRGSGQQAQTLTPDISIGKINHENISKSGMKRIANIVYEMIERKLVIEKEWRGLF